MSEEMPITAKTAIPRIRPSIPAQLAIELREPEDIFFDWGCGRGKDHEYYKEMKCEVESWDPHFKPSPHPSTIQPGRYNFVTCTFVLNTLPEREERLQCLQDIHHFLPATGKALLSVRSREDIEGQAKKGKWKRTGDGWTTQRDTFQKGFETTELKDFARKVFQDAETIRKEPVIILAYKRVPKASLRLYRQISLFDNIPDKHQTFMVCSKKRRRPE